ncbi:hypothetical protein [Bacillus sp. 7884-1]|uniref:hypothetical protein n=1 Tax=Bacillus sp. 7884-1 TaxID=2021693 RepID=UPI0015CE8B02|nr:hypothetical protein [Bacillus sp. 7884-1]
MQILIGLALFSIAVYTCGFGVTLWKEKQKMSAIAVFFLSVTIIILPFFSIFKIS